MCQVKPEISPELNENAPGFYGPGIQNGESGSLNQPLSNGKLCNANGKNLIAHWRLLSNVKYGGYKLTLAVWQGDAAWVGGVERKEGQWHPEPRIALPIEPRPDYQPSRYMLVTGSIASDTAALSDAFSAEIDAR
jgi:hypothetical protein